MELPMSAVEDNPVKTAASNSNAAHHAVVALYRPSTTYLYIPATHIRRVMLDVAYEW